MDSQTHTAERHTNGTANPARTQLKIRDRNTITTGLPLAELNTVGVRYALIIRATGYTLLAVVVNCGAWVYLVESA